MLAFYDIVLKAYKKDKTNQKKKNTNIIIVIFLYLYSKPQKYIYIYRILETSSHEQGVKFSGYSCS